MPSRCRDPSSLRRRRDIGGFVAARRDRLLHIQVLAGRGGGDGEVSVLPGRRANDDCLDPGIVEQLAGLLVSHASGQPPGRRACRRIGICDGNELDTAHALEHAQVNGLCDAAATDQADSDRHYASAT